MIKKYKLYKLYGAGGQSESNEKLNKTLIFITKLLNKHNIQNWFISYGTLLGIIRNNSCIDNDDDIDISCNADDYDNIKKILIQNELQIVTNDIRMGRKILKTKSNNKFASIDFYMCKIDNRSNFVDTWDGSIWSNCYTSNNKLIEFKWNDTILYLPNNFKEKIKRRYGDDWEIPNLNSKGVEPRNNIL
jgi:phosphorylcholine metabolism protein LicD